MRERQRFPGIHPSWLGEGERPYTPPPLASEDEVRAFGEDMQRLTPRRCVVFRARAAGLSIPEIAEAEYIAVQTVKNHSYEALHTLGLPNKMTRAAYLLGRIEGAKETR